MLLCLVKSDTETFEFCINNDDCYNVSSNICITPNIYNWATPACQNSTESPGITYRCYREDNPSDICDDQHPCDIYDDSNRYTCRECPLNAQQNCSDTQFKCSADNSTILRIVSGVNYNCTGPDQWTCLYENYVNCDSSERCIYLSNGLPNCVNTDSSTGSSTTGSTTSGNNPNPGNNSSSDSASSVMWSILF